MKIMISQPMNGLTDEQIQKVRSDAETKLFEAGHEVINNIFNFDEKRYKHPPLIYLAASIHIMATADAVYFIPGWEEARGCAIEREICKRYDIKILDTIPVVKKPEIKEGE